MKTRLLLTMRRMLLLVVCGFLMMTVLLLGRVVFISMFIPGDAQSAHTDALPLLLFNVFRFDAQVAAYTLLPSTLLAMAALLPVGRRYHAFVGTFNKIYFAIVALLLTLLTAIDMGFYRNFGTHINLTFFDFFDEGPWGLLRVVWEEYNVTVYTLALVVCLIVIYFLVGLLEQRMIRFVSKQMTLVDKQTTKATGKTIITVLSTLGILLYLTALFIAMRGSVWMYPLQEEDIYVSESMAVNDCVPNAAYMLKKAWKEKRNSFVIPSDDRLLSDYGFQSVDEALDEYTHGRVAIANDTLTALHDALFATVDAIETPQPNVVIIYAESWSRIMFRIGSESFDVGQGMERHFADDLLFTNIQSVQNGTVASIENIAVSTPYPRLFRSRYRLNVLPTSIALPFRESGYTTEFISGMDMAWENCAEAMGHQAFDRVTDKYHLLAEDKTYAYNGIGIYDEHLLDAIYRRLQEHTDKPQLMLAITTTNHPPFDFPDDMNLSPIPEEVYANEMFAVKDKNVLRKYIDGFRYLNKSLATFLDNVKASPAADNTIIIITGDHNVRSVIDYNVVGNEWKHAVPLYVCLPLSLRKDNHTTMTLRYGSHDDILATLAPMTLSSTHYFKMGNDLLADTLEEGVFCSANVEQTLATDSLITAARRHIRARDMLRHMYFRRIFDNKKGIIANQKHNN